MRVSRSALTLALLIAPLAACDRGTPQAAAPNAALMQRAVAKARATLPQFISAITEPAPTQSGHLLKKPFPTPAGGEEHVILAGVTWDGVAFTGTVALRPAEATGIKPGDRVTVLPSEISDWMYFDDGKLVGGYTERVLHAERSPEEQRAAVAETGVDIPPVDF